MKLFHLQYQLKLLCLLAISFFIEFLLVYAFIPVDVYHQTSLISQTATNFVEFLNTKFPLFPSGLVFIIKQQKMIGALNYIPQLLFLFLLFFLLLLLALKRKPGYIVYASVLHPLIFLETIYKLTHYDLHSFIITPLFILVITLRWVYFKRDWHQYIQLSLLFTLYVFFNDWSIFLTDIIYNKLYLFFVPLAIIKNLNLVIFSLTLSIFFLPFLTNFISTKKLISVLLIFYILLSGLSQKTITMNGKIWHGSWIWSEENRNDQYLVFEKEFIIPKFLLTKSSIDITAKSAYKLYINNRLIGEGPGPIDDKNRYFDSFSLDTHLVTGKNKIRIVAYNFGHDTHFQKKQSGGVLAEIDLRLLNSINLTFTTDKTWKMYEQTGYLPIGKFYPQIKDYEINSGKYVEVYEFTDSRQTYKSPKENSILTTDYLVKRPIPYLLHENILPVKRKQDGGKLSFDFGNVAAGYPLLEIETKGKSTLKIEYFEDANTQNVQETMLIFPNGGKYFYRGFHRLGFLSASLSWKEGDGIIKNFYVDSVRFPADKTGSFQSDDALFNDIYSLGEQTLKYALQDQFEDSFIHERSQYLGDSYLDMLSGFYSLNAGILAKKALYQFASTQKQNGIIETVYPSSLGETILSYNLIYANFLKDYFLYTGDQKTVKDLIPVAERIVSAFEIIKDKDGILNADSIPKLHPGEILAAWINHTRANDRSPDLTISFNALYFKELSALEYLFSYIGEDKRKYYQERKESFRNAFLGYLSRQTLTSIEPHAAVILINSGLLDVIDEKYIYDAVLRNSPPFITGYFNLFYLEAMQQVKDTAGIKNLLYGYWGDMLAQGAKTAWETYDSVDKSRSLSKTHAWSSGPTYFLPAYATGVRPLKPGFETILIEPTMLTDKLSARILLDCGELGIKTERRNNSFLLDVVNPCQKMLVVKLPATKNQIQEFLVNQNPAEAVIEDEKLTYTTRGKSLHINLNTAY